jgi:hypothetical protein
VATQRLRYEDPARRPPGWYIIYETTPEGDLVLERFSTQERTLLFVKRYRNTFHEGAHIRIRVWVEQFVEVD